MLEQTALFNPLDYSIIPTDWSSDDWETPPPVAHFIASLLRPIEKNICEPSAGRGAIAQYLPNGATCIELNPDRFASGAVPHQNWLCGDFLKYAQQPDQFFNVVVGNPPFSLGVEFIKAAMSIIVADGRVLFLLPSDFFQTKRVASQMVNAGIAISRQWQIVGRVSYEKEGITHHGRQCSDAVFELVRADRYEGNIIFVDPYERLAR